MHVDCSILLAVGYNSRFGFFVWSQLTSQKVYFMIFFPWLLWSNSARNSQFTSQNNDNTQQKIKKGTHGTESWTKHVTRTKADIDTR